MDHWAYPGVTSSAPEQRQKRDRGKGLKREQWLLDGFSYPDLNLRGQDSPVFSGILGDDDDDDVCVCIRGRQRYREVLMPSGTSLPFEIWSPTTQCGPHTSGSTITHELELVRNAKSQTPTPDWLNQNLHFSKTLGWVLGTLKLRSTAPERIASGIWLCYMRV